MANEKTLMTENRKYYKSPVMFLIVGNIRQRTTSLGSIFVYSSKSDKVILLDTNLKSDKVILLDTNLTEKRHFETPITEKPSRRAIHRPPRFYIEVDNEV